VNIDDFGMDTITLAGPLDAKLAAMRAAGFTQVMISARDIAGHPGGEAAAALWCGRRPTRDWLSGAARLRLSPSPAYKVDIAKAMLRMCQALGAKVLLVCSSTSTHATGDREHLARDLRKLAMLAVPLGIRIAYEGLSWGRHVNEYTQAWELVEAAAIEPRPA
jgi:sugar phosphate isomerase/epimerase